MRIRQRTAATLALALVVFISSAAARAQVLEQVPADALVALKVKNLKATSDKVAKFLTDLGVAQMEPRLGDPLGALEQQLKVTQGLDRNGEMAFIFIDPERSGGDEDKSMIALLPVSDYQAFLANFPDATTEGEVSQVTIGDSSEPGFLANWGNYAALSPNRDLVANKPSATMKLTATARKEADAKDIVLYANFPAIRERVLPKLAESRNEILAQVEEGMQQEPEAARYAPVVKALVNQLLNAAEAFMRDTDAGLFGVTLTGEGLAFTALADFRPDSYAGRLVAESENTTDLMLAGLPQGKYLMYGGGLNDPEVSTKLIDDLTQPVIAELDQLGGDQAQAVKTYIENLKKQMSAVRSQTFGMVAPAGNLGQEPIFQFVNVMTGDANAIRSGYTEMMKSQEQMMTAFGQPADMVKTTYTPNGKTIEGVSFDVVQSEFNMDAAGPGAAQAQMMMTYMYGPGGINVLIGEVEKKILVSMGAPESVVSSTITAVKSNAAPLADDARVKAVAAQLPQGHMSVFFLAVDEWVNTGLSYAKQFGFNMPVQLPPDLPPIGISIGKDGTAVRVDSYVPSSLVQSLVAAGMQAAMQMQGAGGPGRGGGL